MPGNLTLDQLRDLAADGRIDTVVVAIVDMQGRLMGKRFHVQNFLETAHEETHCCNYLLATDMEMATPDGYAATSWQAGYGDHAMKPDLSTLRLAAWTEGAALVLCDVEDHHSHEPIPHAPRSMLRKMVARLGELGYRCNAATELEFFLYRESYEEARDKQYRDLEPISPYNEDYHLFQTATEEPVMRRLRNTLHAAGVPVESTKGEAERGQEELNIRYTDALDMADNHSIAKHAVKEVAWQAGRSATFLSKTHEGSVGSSSHIHQSLIDVDGEPAFFDADAEHGMSVIMQHYLAGLLKYTRDCTFFLAPYINSYKRFAKGTFAPTRVVWSIDNRTAGYRIVAPDSPGVRVECRIGGADMNPYLAMAAQLAAGIRGIEEGLSMAEEFRGDAYVNDEAEQLPSSLREAAQALRESSMLRDAFGDAVVDHYVRCAEWEQEEFDRIVTDYEVRRGFERV
ncbi:MAG: glutamine synthetase [Gammaproteobacteria bacterium]|nr:MAG: glutamine synthetase [Gammaproteobacteria bacterium]